MDTSLPNSKIPFSVKKSNDFGDNNTIEESLGRTSSIVGFKVAEHRRFLNHELCHHFWTKLWSLVQMMHWFVVVAQLWYGPYFTLLHDVYVWILNVVFIIPLNKLALSFPRDIWHSTLVKVLLNLYDLFRSCTFNNQYVGWRSSIVKRRLWMITIRCHFL